MVLFTLEDFAVFKATTLATRMHLIREQLDPKFAEAATVIVPLLQTDQQAIYSHIAKHQRRYRNPPPNTWVAFSTSSRGYKMVPHLALGFWDDRLFLWLSVLRESKPASRVLTGITAMATTLPGKWQVAGEHTDKAMLPLTSANLATVGARFQTIKEKFIWQMIRFGQIPCGFGRTYNSGLSPLNQCLINWFKTSNVGVIACKWIILNALYENAARIQQNLSAAMFRVVESHCGVARLRVLVKFWRTPILPSSPLGLASKLHHVKGEKPCQMYDFIVCLILSVQ